MTPRDFWNTSDEETLKRVASEAGTTFDNLKQIALYSGACSSRLAKRLSEASGGAMGLEEILFRNEQPGAA